MACPRLQANSEQPLSTVAGIIRDLAPGLIDELELASHLAEHAPDDGRPSFEADRLGVDFRQTTYKDDGGERAPATKLVCPGWSQRTCRRTDRGVMIIDCHGHYTTALREPAPQRPGLREMPIRRAAFYQAARGSEWSMR